MAKLNERDGQYVLRWTDPDGTRKSKSLGKVGVFPKRDAKAILLAKELELTTGMRMLGKGGSTAPTFGRYAREYVTWRGMKFPDSQERVEQIIEQHLIPAFEFVALDSLKPDQVEQWMQVRLTKVKPETVAKELRTLKAVLHHAMDRDVLARDPLRTVTAPRNLESSPIRFYEAHELARIYEASFDKGSVWKLLANTGMRRGEALALNWSNVGPHSIQILSTSEDRTKSGKWREVPLSDGARLALEDLAWNGREGYVLPRIAPESLSRSFVKDAARAGLPGHLHELRHTYVSHLVRAGVPLRTVQVLAGHAHYSTTERYAHVAKGTEPAPVRELSI